MRQFHCDFCLDLVTVDNENVAKTLLCCGHVICKKCMGFGDQHCPKCYKLEELEVLLGKPNALEPQGYIQFPKQTSSDFSFEDAVREACEKTAEHMKRNRP